MTFARPTFRQLRERVGAMFRTRFPGADINLRQSPGRAFVELIAASTDEDLAYLDWQVGQLFPFSADVDYLERWAAAKGLARKGAAAGAGTVTLVGTPGMTAPLGSELQTKTGIVVALSSGVTLGGDGTATVAAAAVAGGVAGNLSAGTILTFVGTPPGFADSGTVASPFAGGADAESDASLRLRTLRAFAEPSFGGNQNDWERAALEVPGVTRVFSQAATPTPGSVTLYPLFDALHENGIPVGVDAYYRPTTGIGGGSGDQLLVLEAILDRRPICASVFVTALVPAPLDLQISSLRPDTEAVRAAISGEYTRMLFRRAVPGGAISRSWIAEAVARAAGEDSHDLDLPVGDTAVPAGQIAVPGVITYV